MKKKSYHWQSNFTGEVVHSFKDVVVTTCQNLRICKGHMFEVFNWSYNKEGF